MPLTVDPGAESVESSLPASPTQQSSSTSARKLSLISDGIHERRPSEVERRSSKHASGDRRSSEMQQLEKQNSTSKLVALSLSEEDKTNDQDAQATKETEQQQEEHNEMTAIPEDSEFVEATTTPAPGISPAHAENRRSPVQTRVSQRRGFRVGSFG
jgi:hypothetical protein